MPWKKGERIPTNLIVGFLGSGKTTAIVNLIQQRLQGEHWSILVNEFGTVSIDHALVDSSHDQIAVEKLGGGCACCTMSFAFKPLLAQFIRRSKPDRLILEPSGVSHPAKVVDLLRSSDFSGVIDLRNIICLIDPKDFDDPKWQESEIFQDQVQLADIVIINWTDSRPQEQVNRCRQWIDSFNPPKQLVVETNFGKIDKELLDKNFNTVRFPLFADAHPTPTAELAGLQVLSAPGEIDTKHVQKAPTLAPGIPNRFPNQGPSYRGCGWLFHVDDVFDRDQLMDFLGALNPIVRLKGVLRCRGNWWAINRAKEATDLSTSTYRRDSRLEIIVDSDSLNWNQVEQGLLSCLLNGNQKNNHPQSLQ